MLVIVFQIYFYMLNLVTRFYNLVTRFLQFVTSAVEEKTLVLTSKVSKKQHIIVLVTYHAFLIS